MTIQEITSWLRSLAANKLEHVDNEQMIELLDCPEQHWPHKVSGWQSLSTKRQQLHPCRVVFQYDMIPL